MDIYGAHGMGGWSRGSCREGGKVGPTRRAGLRDAISPGMGKDTIPVWWGVASGG
jgi:hypothetical protein